MCTILLLRHGESNWNCENRFSGWVDTDLSNQGVVEAQQAGKILKEHGYSFDRAFVSVLKRALKTLWIVLDELDELWIPIDRSWRLNERHYGSLQGLNKSETAIKFGEDQVKIWRRSYDVPPPLLEKESIYHPKKDRRYQNIPDDQLPIGESLKDTVQRVLPYWETNIMPKIKLGEKIIIVAHGNSLRALIQHLLSLSQDEILSLNIPTGIPLVYEFDNSMRVNNHYYLGDPMLIEAAIDKVAKQGKK